ncbi:MAG: hypothetical protein IKC74_03025, partial [Clostridia bacterium]|nr:hypothetical protein [Clostridia bacterium]
MPTISITAPARGHNAKQKTTAQSDIITAHTTAYTEKAAAKRDIRIEPQMGAPAITSAIPQQVNGFSGLILRFTK